MTGSTADVVVLVAEARYEHPGFHGVLISAISLTFFMQTYILSSNIVLFKFRQAEVQAEVQSVMR